MGKNSCTLMRQNSFCQMLCLETNRYYEVSLMSWCICDDWEQQTMLYPCHAAQHLRLTKPPVVVSHG
jgi:hypothetical protein